VVNHTRAEPPTAAGERATLTGFLQYQRETLAWKCAGLSAGQLRERAVPPSALSLLWLIRHMAEVERSWFRCVLNGEKSRPPVWESGERTEFDAGTVDSDEAFRIWHEECARSRDIVDAAESLDITGTYDDEVFSLRYVLAHDRGVRAAQRPCRPDPRAPRRNHWRVASSTWRRRWRATDSRDSAAERSADQSGKPGGPDDLCRRVQFCQRPPSPCGYAIGSVHRGDVPELAAGPVSPGQE
jgi:hypothetical protein